jgi:hypothetical protein
MKWPQDRELLITDMQALLKRELGSSLGIQPSASFDIHIPTVKRKPTELDRHRFARDGYAAIREFSQRGMSQLKSTDDHIEVDFTKIHSTKFVCSVFVDGSRKV